MTTVMVTLSSNFRISVPNAVSNRQGRKVSQELAFIPKGKGVLLTPAPALAQLRGIAQCADPMSCRNREDRC